MCGLVGFIGLQPSLTGEELSSLLCDMSSQIIDRGPDDSGVWIDVDNGVGVAHRRLAILDLSEAGKQPMLSSSGRFVLAFNGEIYNHLALRNEIDGLGKPISWRGHSDTETLLAGFEIFGLEKMLMKSVGMFAIAVWDRSQQCLHLARDRMGEKPLYYGWAGSSLVFGSQVKTFRVHPAWRGDINRDSLSLFFRHSNIPAPYSIYKDIWKLLPGSILTISLQDVKSHHLAEPKTYWSVTAAANLGRAAPFNGDHVEAQAELARRCNEAILLQQVADVPLGAFLSGGIDSTVVAALMQAHSTHPVQTYTVGFSEKGYNEAKFALAVARHLRTEHTELYVTPEQAREVIPLLPHIYDEPFSDPSQIPTYLVSQMARRNVTVSLSGDGGDELFGGYNRYFLGRNLRSKMSQIPLCVRRALASSVMAVPPAILDAFLYPIGKLIPQLGVSQPSDKVYKAMEVLALVRDVDVYRRLVSHWDSPATLVIAGCEPPTILDRLLEKSATEETIEQWMMTTDMQTYLPDDILVKLDRAAMAVSLETRAPFLDHRLIEFSLSLPLDMKIRGGQGKWLLRQMLYEFVPKELVDRPKTGFGIPIDSWLRGPLREWAEELLDERRLCQEGFLNPEPIRMKWTEHISGARNWQYYLWDVLMFQAWLEVELA